MNKLLSKDESIILTILLSMYDRIKYIIKTSNKKNNNTHLKNILLATGQIKTVFLYMVRGVQPNVFSYTISIGITKNLRLD